MAAQAKIQNAHVLIITMRALANEVAKNLALAGVASLSILDGANVTEADLGAQFFLSEDDLGKNRAEAASVALRRLNPRVPVYVDSEGVKSKPASYFAAYDVVIATDLDPDSYNLINTATRINGRPFYGAGTHGMYGFIFSDLIEHDYVIERAMGNVASEPKQETRTRSIVDVKSRKEGDKTIESVSKRELYSTWFLASDLAGLPEEYKGSKRRLRSVSPALSCLRALWEFMQIQGRLPGNRDDLKMFTQIATQKHKALHLPGETLKPEFLRSFLQNLGSEIAPVTAILGGQLAQDVINVLGQTQQPIQNMVIFDGNTMDAHMYPLHPDGVLGASLLSLGGGADMGSNGGGGGNGMMMAPDAGGFNGTMNMMPPPNVPSGYDTTMGQAPSQASAPAGQASEQPAEAEPSTAQAAQDAPAQPAPEPAPAEKAAERPSEQASQKGSADTGASAENHKAEEPKES